MEATDQNEPMSWEQAADSLLMPQEAEGDDQSEDVEDEAEEAPLEDQETDEDEDETEDDDAEAEGEDDDGQEDEGEDDADEDADAEPDEQTFTVKVDGEEKQVTRDELIRGYAGQAYIQKGMREAAEAKKQAEGVYQQLLQEREQVSQFVQRLQQGELVQQPKPPSAELLQTDPISYMEQRAAYDDAKAKYDEQQAQLQRVTAQQSEAQKRAQQAYLQEQQRLLVQAIPELADAQKAGQTREKLVKTGEAYGYSTEEIGQIMDARAIQILNDARKWRELQTGEKATTQKRKPKRQPAIKPGAKKQEKPSKKREQQARDRLRKSGSIHDAVDLIFKS